MRHPSSIRHKALFIVLFLVAFTTRIIKLGPNFELVTTVMILSSYYLGKKQSLFLVFLILFVTDLILGNTNIFLFTWSGFLIPTFLISGVLKKIKLNKILVGTGLGISTNIFFYFWTNFGVWLLDSWGMYPKTLAGLLICFINGLPFLKNQFISSLIFIPLGYFAGNLYLKIYPRLGKIFLNLASKIGQII
jgi:hypothetical protein